jgi:hypothetical protein
MNNLLADHALGPERQLERRESWLIAATTYCTLAYPTVQNTLKLKYLPIAALKFGQPPRPIQGISGRISVEFQILIVDDSFAVRKCIRTL